MSSLNSTLVKKISRRYAQALLGLTLAKNTVEDVYADVVLLTESLKSSPELRDFVADPQHPAPLFKSAISELFKNKIQPGTFDFLMFLIEKGRLNILNEILSTFTDLYQQRNKIGKVEITSAAPLTAEQVDAITKKLAVRWKQDFIAETKVDSTLIGGFLIKSGDQVLDYSMKNQLEKFRRQVINA